MMSPSTHGLVVCICVLACSQSVFVNYSHSVLESWKLLDTELAGLCAGMELWSGLPCGVVM